MDSLLEKFSKLGCDNAPGQEGRQKAAVLDLRGEKLEGRLVDFSHGDVDAHPPIPGTLSDFVTGVEKIGGHQAYTEYRATAASAASWLKRSPRLPALPLIPIRTSF